jgi:hypothetical protein
MTTLSVPLPAIEYPYGKAYATIFVRTDKAVKLGFSGESKSIYLGTEAAIKEAIRTGQVTAATSDIQRYLIGEIIASTEVPEDGKVQRIIPAKRTYQPGTRKASSERSGPMLDARRRAPRARRAAVEKRFSNRISQQDNPRLFDIGNNQLAKS